MSQVMITQSHDTEKIIKDSRADNVKELALSRLFSFVFFG